MNKLIYVLALGGVFVLTSCGGEEKKDEKLPTFCECINAKGAPPSGCDKVVPEDMSEDEFNKKYEECKEKK